MTAPAVTEALERSDIAIPISIQDVDESVAGWPFRNAYCWECGTRQNVSGIGRYALCSGCRASINQQAREQAFEDRRMCEEAI